MKTNVVADRDRLAVFQIFLAIVLDHGIRMPALEHLIGKVSCWIGHLWPSFRKHAGTGVTHRRVAFQEHGDDAMIFLTLSISLPSSRGITDRPFCSHAPRN